MTRDEMLGKLVTRSDIRDMAGVSHVAVIMTWMTRYPDFPAPVLAGSSPCPYWWRPDVEKFLRRNKLPRYTRKHEKECLSCPTSTSAR